MKKCILSFILGLTIMGFTVFATEILMDAKSISYSSEYTENENVADALTELLGSGTGLASLHKEYPNLTILSGNTMWADYSPYYPCYSFPTFGYKYISVTIKITRNSGSGTVYFNDETVGTFSYATSTSTFKNKMTDDDTTNGIAKICVWGSSSIPSIVSDITYSME